MSEFAEYIKEVLAGFGDVRIRRMFGGFGVFHNDLMIGLIADDVMYFKADSQSAKSFSDKGLEQFEYIKNGKPMKMSYFMAPEEIFDDPSEAKKWATLAYDAALRSRKPAKKKRKQSQA